MSKINGRCIHNSLSSYSQTILSNFISAYKKPYSSNHVLSRLTENWKKSRNNKNFLSNVLMDLSKAFDCILLLQNVMYMVYQRMYNFSAFTLQTHKIGCKKGTESVFQILLSVIP